MVAPKLLSQRTQSEINALILQEEPMSTEVAEAPTAEAAPVPFNDSVEIEGRMKSGDGYYSVRLRLAVSEENLGNPEFSAYLSGVISNLGVDPLPATAAAPAQPGGGGAPTATGTPGAGCPTHGLSNAKQGFRGQGQECKAFASVKQDWSQDKPWVSKDGEVRFYCKSKW